jgi:hypothetical protein
MIETPGLVAAGVIGFLPDISIIFEVAYDRASSKGSGLPEPKPHG